LRETLAARSSVTYGREFAMVAADRGALLQQIEMADDEAASDGQRGRANTDPENGRIPPASAGSVTGPTGSVPRSRNEQRASKASGEPRLTQATLALAADESDLPPAKSEGEGGDEGAG
jgi:hypothetical protein